MFRDLTLGVSVRKFLRKRYKSHNETCSIYFRFSGSYRHPIFLSPSKQANENCIISVVSQRTKLTTAFTASNFQLKQNFVPY